VECRDEINATKLQDLAHGLPEFKNSSVNILLHAADLHFNISISFLSVSCIYNLRPKKRIRGFLVDFLFCWIFQLSGLSWDLNFRIFVDF
jgi:hypothetical protein